MHLRIGIHLSYWQTEWSDDLAVLIEKAKQSGFDGAEFPLLTPQALDYANLRAVLDANGMGATCGTGLDPSTDITSPDADVRAEGIAHLRACLEGAAALGSPVVGGVTYAPWGVFPALHNRPEHRARCVESLRAVSRIAEDTGVTLCLEIVNRFEGWIINSVEQGIDLLAEIDSPYIKLHLDTFHQNIEEDDPLDAIRRAGEHIGHFHCSENNRKPPGNGHIDWPGVGAALADAAFDGWLVVESFTQPDCEVGEALAIRRPLIEDTLDADITRAASLLREEVAGAAS